MATMTASASLQFIIVFLMVAFSAVFCQVVDNPTGGICNNRNNNSTVCQGVKGLKFSNVSKLGSSSSPRTSSSSSSTPATKSPSSTTPATKSPTRGGTAKSPPRSDSGSSDDSSKSMSSPFILAHPSLQAVALAQIFNLNKASPKDDLPLPNIDMTMDSIASFSELFEEERIHNTAWLLVKIHRRWDDIERTLKNF